MTAAVSNSPVFLIIIAIAPAAAILIYYLRVVRFAPEPWPRVVLCCMAGGLAFVAAASIEQQLSAVVPRDRPWLWSFVVIAPVEETLKLLAVLIAAPWPTRYERVSSGLMYGVAAGAAFACVENVVYVTEYGATTALLRAFTAVPAHALHCAIVGLSAGLVHRTNGTARRLTIVAIGLGLAILLHGTYDGLLLGAENLRGLAVVLVASEAFVVRYGARRVLERDLQKDMDLLAAVPLFDTVPASSLRILASGATRQRAEAGAVIVRRGRPGEAMFQIMRGELDVRLDDRILQTMGAGDFFGEQSLLTGGVRSADVVAKQKSLLLRVPRRVLLRAVHGDLELARAVVSRARERFPDGALPTPEALLGSAAQAASVGVVDELAVRLGTSDLLRGLPTEDLGQLASACVFVKRGPAATLVRAGRMGPGLSFIVAGSATVSAGHRTLTELEEGDYFSEISLLTGWSATATVVSNTPVQLAVLRWVDLEDVVARNPRLGWQLLLGVSTRIARERGAPVSSPMASAVWRILSRIGRRLSPWDAPTEALYHALPSVRSLPRSAVETLRHFAEPMPRGPPEDDAVDAVWIGEGGGLAGALGRYEPDGCEEGPGWWRLSIDHSMNGIARCPNLLRFLARLMIGGRHRPRD